MVPQIRNWLEMVSYTTYSRLECVLQDTARLVMVSYRISNTARLEMVPYMMLEMVSYKTYS